MHKNMRFFHIKIFAVIAIFILTVIPVFAAEKAYSVEYEEENYLIGYCDESGYYVVIDDSADLFTEDEERSIAGYMADCADNGYVYLVTTDYNTYSDAYDYARAYYESVMEGESGVLYLIDMDTRQLRFYADGYYKRILTSDKFNVITDNVYKMASNEDYYGCVVESFSEVSDVLKGIRISQPMKYICNGLLAILFALVINYFVARMASKTYKPSNNAILKAINSNIEFSNPSVKYINSTKTYSPRSSGSGGSSSGGGGGGGSSGGHGF